MSLLLQNQLQHNVGRPIFHFYITNLLLATIYAGINDRFSYQASIYSVLILLRFYYHQGGKLMKMGFPSWGYERTKWADIYRRLDTER